MLKLRRYFNSGRYAFKVYSIIIIHNVSAIINYLQIKSAFRQARELARQNSQRPHGVNKWFTTDERSVVEILSSLIVPEDGESPGAQDANVADTVEAYVAKSERKKEIYSRGLYSLDEWSKWKYGEPFKRLSHENRLNLLKLIDQESNHLYRPSSKICKIRQKFKILPYWKRGLFDAVELFPIVVEDVLKAFYTSEVSWIWLGYDGPPMPEGYPDLSERRPNVEEPETIPTYPLPSAVDKPLRILVCVKQVPNNDSIYTIDDTSYEIKEDNLVYETNECDLYALEEALRLKTKTGGEVVVLSLGENRVLKSLKDGLAKGADRAIHLDDPGFQESDAFLTAKAISAVIKIEEFGIVFTGVESTDLAYGQTGVILAELLGWPYATIAVKVDVDKKRQMIRVKRELENNAFEWVEMPLPAVITVQTGINEPRYSTLTGILQARKKEIRKISAKELGLKPSELGGYGCLIDSIGFYRSARKKNTIMLEGTASEVANELIQRLQQDAKIL